MDPGDYAIVEFSRVDDSMRAQIGGKGFRLAQMCRAGLPVPAGYCLTTAVHRDYIESGRVAPQLLERLSEVRTALGGAVAVRSSASCEDGESLSMAGVFETVYVDTDVELGRALSSIYDQSRSSEVSNFLTLHGRGVDSVNMGIVVQRLVAPSYSGVLYNRTDLDELLVQTIAGYGRPLVDGESQGECHLLRLSDGAVTDCTAWLMPRSHRQQLVHAVLALQQMYAGEHLDVEFAFENDRLQLLQCRPLVCSPSRFYVTLSREAYVRKVKSRIEELSRSECSELGTSIAIFSDSNYSELLPRPAPFDIGLYASIFTGLDGIEGATQIARRQMGYKPLLASVGGITEIGGRTYFSIARNASLYYIGIPCSERDYINTYINGYLSAIERNHRLAAYPQMGLYVQDPTEAHLLELFPEKAAWYLEIYEKFVARLGSLADTFCDEYRNVEEPQLKAFVLHMQAQPLVGQSMPELLKRAERLLEHLRQVTCVSFVKAARYGFYYSQRLVRLLEAELRVSAAESAKLFSLLTQGLELSEITQANLRIAECGSDADALELAQELVGHFSTGEMLEIRHQRLCDSEEALHGYVEGLRSGSSYAASFRRQVVQRTALERDVLQRSPPAARNEFAQCMSRAQQYMALRESVKYQFSKEYSLLKDVLQMMERQLPIEAGDIYFCYPRELKSLVHGPDEVIYLLRSRRREFEVAAGLSMPAVLLSSDAADMDFCEAATDDWSQQRGIFLAAGPACEGFVLNVEDQASTAALIDSVRALKAAGRKVLLAARQFNLSHDPSILLADGLLIENAGLVSHGAQRARELGKGAISGIPLRSLRTGMIVQFDPESACVRLIRTLSAGSPETLEKAST